MEEDEDDFYGTGSGVKQEQEEDGDDKEEKMDVSEGEEEEDSDDDVQFTLEKPEGAKSEPPAKQQKTRHDRTTSDSRPAKSSTPIKQETAKEATRAGSTAPPPSTAFKGTLTHNGKEGKDYPEVRTSKIEVDGTPVWPPNGKPITEVDIDADLAENSKPWRLPGTDITDFFNYGFDEYTWTSYCIRQHMMSNTIGEQKQQDAQMKALLGSGGGGGGGGMPGMPPGMPMPGPEQMEMMMQSGAFPPEFMQMMQQGMPGVGGGGQGGGFQGGGFGSGQNSASPHPQAGQGFQPPQGPSGGQGQQGGFPPGNMEGFSPQQIAIMQQEQQGGMGGGGGGGRGRGRNRRGGW